MKYSIDSTKVRIPTGHCSFIDPSITAVWYLVNYETGESLTKDSKSYDHEYKGIKTRFAIEKQITADQTVHEFLTFVITAKMIGKKYLEGITPDHLQTVYDYITGIGLASFTFDDFKRAQCTDTDIKKDFTNPEGVKIVGRLVEQAIPRKQGRAATLWKKKHNQGIQWNERGTDKFMTQPYLKIYSKWCDLQSKSASFADAHGIKVSPDYWRIETTVKNRQHWKKHDITDTTLWNIVNLEQDKLEDIMTTALRAHLEPTTRTRARASDGQLSPQDTVTANAMYFLIESGHTYGSIERTLLQGLTGHNKSKHKGRLKVIYQNHILPTPEGEKSDKVHQVFEAIGYTF